MAVDNSYSRADGASSHGQNTIVHYYDKAGVKAANEVSVYAQFADRRSMPLKMGLTYKVSKWLHIYDRDPTTDADFGAKGYLSARDIVATHDNLKATDGTGAALAEGAGITNKVSIKKVTIETNFARYGEMLDYTDEVELFSEDAVQVHYREELGMLANRRVEDLIQLDLLGGTQMMYCGTATSTETCGQDTTDETGGDDDDSRISYTLIRKAVRKLVRNRAIKNTTIVTGSTKIDTRTINKAFYAVIGPEVKYDLEEVVKGTVTAGGVAEYAYIPTYKYADATNMAEGEVGAMGDVRFVESESQLVYAGAGAKAPSAVTAGDGGYGGDLAVTTLDTAGAAALDTYQGVTEYANGEQRFDVFPIILPTKGSFATVGLKGQGKIKFNSQAPSKIEISNPYGTQGFFSYNVWYAGIILRDERLLQIQVCASA